MVKKIRLQRLTPCTDTSRLTIIANYIPLEEPAGGPNFFPFDPNVRYEIHVDNNGDGNADINYNFRFATRTTAVNFAGIPTFLYSDGPVTSLTDPNLLVKQTYTVQRDSGTYYYRVRALLDIKGITSPYSNVVSAVVSATDRPDSTLQPAIVAR